MNFSKVKSPKPFYLISAVIEIQEFQIFIDRPAPFEWLKLANNGKGPKNVQKWHLLNAQVEKPLLRNHDFQGQPQVALNFNFHLTSVLLGRNSSESSYFLSWSIFRIFVPLKSKLFLTLELKRVQKI